MHAQHDDKTGIVTPALVEMSLFVCFQCCKLNNEQCARWVCDFINENPKNTFIQILKDYVR